MVRLCCVGEPPYFGRSSLLKYILQHPSAVNHVDSNLIILGFQSQHPIKISLPKWAVNNLASSFLLLLFLNDLFMDFML